MSQNNTPKYLVMDIVFYGGSLNYDQGSGNYQELKKVTMYDGSVKILVSRWALRYSMLEMGRDLFGWKLASYPDLIAVKEENQKVPQINKNIWFNWENQLDKLERLKDKMSGDEKRIWEDALQKIREEKFEEIGVDLVDKLIKLKNDSRVSREKRSIAEEIMSNLKVKINLFENFPEFDLYGYMITIGGENAFVRVTPVKISHAVSLNTYNFDYQFMANLGITKRANESGSNPVNIEEFYGFYIYNITVDLQRIGVLDDDPNKKIDDNLRKERVDQLIEIVMNLKRDIKGKREDLSPWLVVAGVYENMNYDTYMDKIELVKTNSTKVLRTERKSKEENGKEVIEITQFEENTDRPKFRVVDFRKKDKVFVFKRDKIEIEGVEEDVLVDDKEKFIKQIKEEIKGAFNN